MFFSILATNFWTTFTWSDLKKWRVLYFPFFGKLKAVLTDLLELEPQCRHTWRRRRWWRRWRRRRRSDRRGGLRPAPTPASASSAPPGRWAVSLWSAARRSGCPSRPDRCAGSPRGEPWPVSPARTAPSVPLAAACCGPASPPKCSGQPKTSWLDFSWPMAYIWTTCRSVFFFESVDSACRGHQRYWYRCPRRWSHLDLLAVALQFAVVFSQIGVAALVLVVAAARLLVGLVDLLFGDALGRWVMAAGRVVQLADVTLQVRLSVKKSMHDQWNASDPRLHFALNLELSRFSKQKNMRLLTCF